MSSNWSQEAHDRSADLQRSGAEPISGELALHDPTSSEEPAILAGRDLATDLVLEASEMLEDPFDVEALWTSLRHAEDRLAPFGIRFEILRTSEGCAVLRSRPTTDRGLASEACKVTRGLLETLPRLVVDAETVLIETRCVDRGDDSCLFTLLWEANGASCEVPSVTATPVEVHSLGVHRLDLDGSGAEPENSEDGDAFVSPGESDPVATGEDAESDTTPSEPSDESGQTGLEPIELDGSAPNGAPADPAAFVGHGPRFDPYLASFGPVLEPIEPIEPSEPIEPIEPSGPIGPMPEGVGDPAASYELDGDGRHGKATEVAGSATGEAGAPALYDFEQDARNLVDDSSVSELRELGAIDELLSEVAGTDDGYLDEVGEPAAPVATAPDEPPPSAAAGSLVDEVAPSADAAPVVMPNALEASRDPAAVLRPGRRPWLFVPRPPTEPGVAATAGERGEPGFRAPGRLRLLAPWLVRRAWAVVLLAVVGALGGYAIGSGHHPSYAAKALLVVRSGTTASNPGSAQEAAALAVTYAALLPNDAALGEAIGAKLGVPASTVQSSLSATAESGTALFLVTYTAGTPQAAITGVNDAAQLVGSVRPPGSAFVRRSVAVVQSATAATPKGSSAKTTAVVGGLAGVMLGFILLIALERVDARADDAEDLADTCGCPSTRLPDGMSIRELAAALARSHGGERSFTVVPVAAAAAPPARRLAERLESWWPSEGDGRPEIALSAPYDASPSELSEGVGPTILAVPAGQPTRSLTAMSERLRILERDPAFAVLCEPERESRWPYGT